jgi:DNA-binding CsgD family transcriptional regulator/GAF domain-containing protein
VPSATGSPPEDTPVAAATGLHGRIAEVLTRAESLLGLQFGLTGTDADLDVAQERLGLAFRGAVERMRDSGARFMPGADLGEVCDLLVDIQAVQQEVAGRAPRHLSEPLAGVRDALARLRGPLSVRELLDRAPVEVCRGCGFDRSALFRLDGSAMVVESVHVEGAAEGTEEFVAAARAHPPKLDHQLLETEMIRRGRPLLVIDARHDPRTFKPLVTATGARSYVAAPLMPSGRVIGFLHADHHTSGRQVGELDRDVIAAFAEGLGYALERSILHARLHRQRDRVQATMSSAARMLDECTEAEIELTADDRQATPSGAARVVSQLPPDSRLEALLTRREAEVLALMAEGATNLAIAERLVISEGTVKSHVKSILRKLRAANRAEAVSRYMRLRAAG